MLHIVRKIGLAGIALLGCSAVVHAEEISLFKIPEAKEAAIAFYDTKDPKNKNKPISFGKPGKIAQIFYKKGEKEGRVKVYDLESGQEAWVAMDAIKDITTLEASLKHDDGSYQCQVSIRDPKGLETGNYSVSKSWGASSADEFKKFNEEFAKQWVALAEMMSIAREKKQAERTEEEFPNDGKKPSVTKQETTQSVTVKG